MRVRERASLSEIKGGKDAKEERDLGLERRRLSYNWSTIGRVEERRRASAEKEKFTIEYTFRHPLLKSEHVVLGDVTVCCLSLVDLGHIFSKFYYETIKSEHFFTPTILS